MTTTSSIRPSGGLFTHHFVEAIQQKRFRHDALAPEAFALPGQDPPTETELEAKIAEAWELLIERWESINDEFPENDISVLRSKWVRPLFYLLDFELDYQRADLVIHDQPFNVTFLGRARKNITRYIAPIHSVLPGGPEGLEIRPGPRRREPKYLAPHDMLQRFLNFEVDYDWGLLTDGTYFRILRDYHHTHSRGYVEFDLKIIFDTRDFEAFRALYRMAHASRFLKPEEEADLPLEQFYQHALSTGVKVGEDLRQNVKRSIETLANGFLQATPELLDELRSGSALHYADFGEMEPVPAFFHDILTTIYRMLFLLYAEQRAMLPGRGSLYMDEFSLTSLRTRAERAIPEDRHLDLWERLQTTFEMVEDGCSELDIFGYNGALFSRRRTPILTAVETSEVSKALGALRGLAGACYNHALLNAVRYLTTVEQEGTLQRVSYADLSVEEIGSIYESLLDYTPQISESALEVEGEQIPPGNFYLDPRGLERKSTGSYYTHPSLVDQLIISALLPVAWDRMMQEGLPVIEEDRIGEESLGLLEGYTGLTGAERQAGEQSLLDLTVVDPAAGSGHFLVAATNTLGAELARVRSGDAYPGERELGIAKRDVLANCIYAVDLNPMAVELCKVSLWINASVRDQPLNFLDHHIKCGNSLVGATPELLKEGVPYEAFALGKPGDDRELAKRFRKQNRQERKHYEDHDAFQPQLGLYHSTTQEELDEFLEVRDLAASYPHQARERYDEYITSNDYQRSKLEADMWAAAFFWPMPEGTEWAPTFGELRKLQNQGPEVIPTEMLAKVSNIAEEQRFFHWYLEFPEVFVEEKRSGFDIVLGNPPWERIKLQEKEFFLGKIPDIAASGSAAKRKKMIQKLKKGKPKLYQNYQKAKHSSESLSEFFRESEKYPLSASGDINTYQIFSGLVKRIISEYGRAGIIVPTGIATDYYNQDFFSSLMEDYALVSLFDFENKKRLFPEVAPPMRFSLLTISGLQRPKTRPTFAFFLHQARDLENESRRYNMSFSDIKTLNPNTHTCPIFVNEYDADLTLKLYKRSNVIINENENSNLWEVSFKSMFHMTNDSINFHTIEELKQKKYQLEGNHFTNGTIMKPLYEAKFIHQYDHRLNTFEGTTEEGRKSVKAFAPEVTNKQHREADYLPQPRYWVSQNEVKQRIDVHENYCRWFLAYRSIINVSTNRRTSVFCVIPIIGMGNSAGLMSSEKSPVLVSCLLSNLNSIPFDWITRQKIGGSNLNFYIVKQLPVFTPDTFGKQIVNYIVPRVFELVYTAWDLKAYADDIWVNADKDLREVLAEQWEDNRLITGGGHFGETQPDWVKYFQPKEPANPSPYAPFMWNEERRYKLRTDLDGLYSHLYGLQRDELAYILDTFPIVERKDRKEFGEFRTKRLVLEAYDRLANRTDEFGFPEKGPSVLEEGYTSPATQINESKEPESEDDKGSQVVEEKEKNNSSSSQTKAVVKETEEKISQPVSDDNPQLTPDHGFSFYLEVQKLLTGDPPISLIYETVTQHPDTTTPEAIARIISETTKYKISSA